MVYQVNQTIYEFKEINATIEQFNYSQYSYNSFPNFTYFFIVRIHQIFVPSPKRQGIRVYNNFPLTNNRLSTGYQRPSFLLSFIFDYTSPTPSHSRKTTDSSNLITRPLLSTKPSLTHHTSFLHNITLTYHVSWLPFPIILIIIQS